MKHKAYRAGLHYDLRIQDPKNDNKFYSFRLIYDAEKPLELKYLNFKDKTTKIVAIETTIHTKEEAYFTGHIPKGQYGGGDINKYFESEIDIEKYRYKKDKAYFIFKILSGMYKNQRWMLFKMTKDKIGQGTIWTLTKLK